jgi:hypothetical protein
MMITVCDQANEAYPVFFGARHRSTGVFLIQAKLRATTTNNSLPTTRCATPFAGALSSRFSGAGPPQTLAEWLRRSATSGRRQPPAGRTHRRRLGLRRRSVANG